MRNGLLLRAIILLLVLPAMAPLQPPRASAAPSGAGADLPLSAAGHSGDVVLRGSPAAQTLSFQVYPHWRVEPGSELRLALRYSPLLVGDLSSLTVSMDGTPLGAVRLDPAGAAGTTMTVKLPAVRPADGALKFELEAVLRTSSAACTDPNDPGAYLVLAPASTLHLEYTALARDLRLEDAPNLLITGAKLPGNRVIFVLPAEPQISDWQAASMIAARLGQLAGDNPLRISVLAANDQPGRDLGDSSLVYVGGAGLGDRLAGADYAVGAGPGGEAGAFLLDEQPVDDRDGLLALAPLPWSQNGVALIVAGGSQEALLNAARVLLDESRLALLQGPKARIPATVQLAPPQARTPLAEAPSATFRQLGLGDRTVRGVGTRSITETVFLPPYWRVAGDGELTLDFGYSDLLLGDRSELTVLLNGAPVHSSALPQGEPGRKTKVTLPGLHWRAGDNTLEFRFEMHVQGEQENCAPADAAKVWASVYATSGLELRYAVDLTRRVDLGVYPYPFSGAGAEQEPARVVLPHSPTPGEQAAGLTIVAGLSRFVPRGESVPLVVPAEREEAARYTHDMILLGGPQRNPVSKLINNRLPVQWDGNTAQTLRTQWGLVLPAQGQGDLALVQEVLSPWNPNRAVLDAGYTRPGMADRVAAAIGQGLYVGKFSGDVLVIGLEGNTTAIDTTAPAVAAPETSPTPVVASTEEPRSPRNEDALGTLAMLLAALLLLGMIVLVLRFIPRAPAAEETTGTG